MPRGDLVDRLTRRNHQHVHWRHAQLTSRHALGHQVAELVQTLEQLDVALQTVNECAVEHVPADLRQRRLLPGVGALQRLLRIKTARVAAHTHHQHPTRAQVQRRTDRCRLAHCAVAEIFLTDFDRGKQQRDRRTGQQMVHRQLRRHADPSMAQPRIDLAAALIEGHRLPRFVAERGHRHRMQLLAGDGFGDAGHV